jgi:hypothetical protein
VIDVSGQSFIGTGIKSAPSGILKAQSYVEGCNGLEDLKFEQKVGVGEVRIVVIKSIYANTHNSTTN